jgi:hypothetical protein
MKNTIQLKKHYAPQHGALYDITNEENFDSFVENGKVYNRVINKYESQPGKTRIETEWHGPTFITPDGLRKNIRRQISFVRGVSMFAYIQMKGFSVAI